MSDETSHSATTPSATSSAGQDLPAGWGHRDGALQAVYQTGDFATGLRLVNAIGAAAEQANHHPDITLTYPSVEVRLVSHDVGAVTDRDHRLAGQIAQIADELGIPPE